MCCATSLAGPSLSKQLCSSLFGYTGSLWHSLDFYPSQNCLSGDMHSRLPPSKYQFFLRDVQQQTWSISAPLCSLYALCNWGSEHQRGRVLLQVQSWCLQIIWPEPRSREVSGLWIKLYHWTAMLIIFFCISAAHAIPACGVLQASVKTTGFWWRRKPAIL